MAKVKKKYQDLLGVARAINTLTGNKEHAEANTKGVKKLQKIGEKLKSHLDTYNEKLEDVRLDCANTDKDGSLLLDEEFEFYQLTFSTEGLDKYAFLEGFVEGLEFPEEVEEDLDESVPELPIEEA